MRDRYEIMPVATSGFVIRDHALRALCRLEGKTLRFTKREAARAWLDHCYKTWGYNPADTESPPPADQWGLKRYDARPPRMSPWTTYVTPVAPSERPYWAQ